MVSGTAQIGPVEEYSRATLDSPQWSPWRKLKQITIDIYKKPSTLSLMDMNKTLQNISHKTADCAELYLTLTNRIPVLKRQIKVAQEAANSYSKELEKLDMKFGATREWEDMADELFDIVDEAEDNVSELRCELIETEERLFDMEDLISEAYGALIDAADAAWPNR